MDQNGYLRRGAALAWARKRYLGWLYAANLALSAAAAAAVAHEAGALLNHSLAAGRLLHGFGVGTLQAVVASPGFDLSTMAQLSTATAGLYFLAVLLFTPGIVYSFVHDERASAANLFRNSGAYLWAFVRLVLWTALIALPILGALNAGRGLLLKTVGERTGDERIQLAVSLSTLALVVVVAWFLRLWFDLAEFHLVRREDRASRKTLGPSWRALRSAPWRLLGMHAACALAGFVVLALGLCAWWYVPSPSVWLALLVGQATMVALLAARYWQRASEAAWFTSNIPVETPAALPIPVATQGMASEAALPKAPV